MKRRLILALVAVAALLAPVSAANASDSYVPISGAGSTWSQVAVDAWRADVRASGVVVNFAGTGSTDGRSQFIQGTVDFANTEIPFQNPPEPGQQMAPETPARCGRSSAARPSTGACPPSSGAGASPREPSAGSVSATAP